MSDEDGETKNTTDHSSLNKPQPHLPSSGVDFCTWATAAFSRSPYHTGASEWSVRGPAGDATRTSSGVHVTSKSQVMKVFEDRPGYYSVSGYAPRARASIGEIYLCLDKGRKYAEQSLAANSAISEVSQQQSHAIALEHTKVVLSGNRHRTDIQLISDQVISALCEHWFDLPDGVNVHAGGLSSSEDPPRCGRDVVFPSGYIFRPDPPPGLPELATYVGPILRKAVLKYVAECRAAGREPKGKLSKSIFEAFPPGEEDLVARTIIGVMMGMVPTVDGNFTRTVTAWRGNGTFASLQEVLLHHPSSDDFSRARAVLLEELIKTMQSNPVPEAVWRTAVADHRIGETNPITVHAGDKIYVNIMSATNEDLAAGKVDAFPIFGGDRRSASRGTHACPGYDMAIGMLLGMIQGLMETPDEMGDAK